MYVTSGAYNLMSAETVQSIILLRAEDKSSFTLLSVNDWVRNWQCEQIACMILWPPYMERYIIQPSEKLFL